MKAIEIAAVCIICIIILLSGIFFLLLKYRENMKKSKNMILQMLDRAIGGNEQIVVYDESIDSAIGERLNQLLDISKTNCAQAEEERNRMKAMISDISHQVRTPLTNMMLYAGLLEESDLSQQHHKMAVQIHKQAEKLEFYLKELTRYSYLETDMISVKAVSNPVDDLIENACQMVELAAMKKKITIAYETCTDVCCFDMKWTIEALVNVLDNAVKYSPEESEIVITTINYESFICIQVTDHGIGIAEEEQGLIFHRFYRSEVAAGKKGLGIGLYLTREITERQGGYVKVTSSPGEGTTFSMFLSARAGIKSE